MTPNPILVAMFRSMLRLTTLRVCQ